jgi:signal transduction histidine kinase
MSESPRQNFRKVATGSIPRLMRIFTRRGSSVLLLLVLLAEAGVGIFVMRDLAESSGAAQEMYGRSVRGLRQIGELQYEASETRHRTLYAMTTNDGNLQVSYADQSREADRRVTQGIAEYLARARTSQETGVGQRLIKDWTNYLGVRDEVLGLILEGGTKEAVEIDLTSGVPLFESVRQDLEEIKRLYDEQASQQLAAVSESSRRSRIKLGAIVGFSLLFGSIAIWAIQRGQVRSAMALAKLQMDFVASVSHELRTPITAILSGAENIRDGFVQGRALTEQGTIITDQATRLMDLVNQVLLFAATSKGKSVSPLHEVQVSEIVEDALRNTKTVLEGGGFTVQEEIEPRLPPVVGDLSVLSQCLQNLIVNAVKYSDRDRWLGISARKDAAAQEVRISIADHGIGISEADLEHIFEPFYRGANVVRTKIHGTGLGLSIAKRTAEAFGGRLTVMTKVGAGSVFTLHLPAAADEKMEAAAMSPVVNVGQNNERKHSAD